VLPAPVAAAIASLSALTHFGAVTRGVLGLADVLYWISLTVFWLFVNAVIVNLKKAD